MTKTTGNTLKYDKSKMYLDTRLTPSVVMQLITLRNIFDRNSEMIAQVELNEDTWNVEMITDSFRCKSVGRSLKEDRGSVICM